MRDFQHSSGTELPNRLRWRHIQRRMVRQ